jgi:Uma2 family endonuclease
MTTLILNLKSTTGVTQAQFEQICQHNQDVQVELTASGKLVIMPPTGWETGNRNGRLTQRLFNWTDANGMGIAFDSSTGFILPNGANRSPDGAWVNRERLIALNPDPKKFLPIAPDFVVELRSATDTLDSLRQKMAEYITNGVRLGWLIDPQNQQVEIYRQQQQVEVLRSPTHLSGEDVLPGFILDLAQILN